MQQFCEDVTVRRNDEITLEEVAFYSHIVLSPGPGLPKDAGILMALLERYANQKPILGVCLGMQAIALHFGASLYNLPIVRHGQAVPIKLDNTAYIFANLPEEINVGLYHSWAVNTQTLPDQIVPIAQSFEGVCMALRHLELPIYGVQFHPESVLTPQGKTIIHNWILSSTD